MLAWGWTHQANDWVNICHANLANIKIFQTYVSLCTLRVNETCITQLGMCDIWGPSTNSAIYSPPTKCCAMPGVWQLNNKAGQPDRIILDLNERSADIKTFSGHVLLGWRKIQFLVRNLSLNLGHQNLFSFGDFTSQLKVRISYGATVTKLIRFSKCPGQFICDGQIKYCS